MPSFTLKVGTDNAVYLGKEAFVDPELFCIASNVDCANLGAFSLAHDLADHNHKHRFDTSKVTVEEELQAIGAYLARATNNYEEPSFQTASVASYAVYRGRDLNPIPKIMEAQVLEIAPMFFDRKNYRNLINQLREVTTLTVREAGKYARIAIQHVALGYFYTELKCRGSFIAADRYAFILSMAEETLQALEDSNAQKLVCTYDLDKHLYNFNLYGDLP